MKQLLPPLAGLFIATALPAQTPAISLRVTLGDSDQLVELDPYTFRELRRIKVDPKPHGLEISPDGSKVYVASDKTGNFWSPRRTARPSTSPSPSCSASWWSIWQRAG